jgi:hypothetical protein
MGFVIKILKEGTEKARLRGQETMALVKEAMSIHHEKQLFAHPSDFL